MYEFFMTYQWEMWAVAALVFLVLEIMAGDFFMLCLAAGAVCSAVAAACGGSFTLCLVLCSVITVASLFFLRPKALKRFRGGKTRKSNADALDGKTGIVKEEIKTGGYGYVGIDGDMWRSISESGEAIPAGTKVMVISHESIILTVKPAEA